MDGIRQGRSAILQAKPKPTPNSGLIQQSPAKLKQRKSLDFLRRIEPYQGITPTPRALFSFCAASRLKGGNGRRRRCPFARVRVSFPWSSFRVRPAFSSEVKGWRLFMIADARASFVRLGGRGADEREKGTRGPRIQRTGTSRKKTGRSIRCPARIRPLQKSPNRFRAFGKRTGASPSCRECLTTPAF